MFLPTTQRNKFWWWWNIKRSKIYYPYYWENNKSKSWGFNIPFIGYFSRYYGEIKFYNLKAKNKYWIF